jgi:hypothetical protein
VFTKNSDFLIQQKSKGDANSDLKHENSITHELEKLSEDFGCKITIKIELLRCANQWKERLGSNTSSVFQKG